MERQNALVFIIWSGLLLVGLGVAQAADNGGFLGKNSVEARRILQERLEHQPKSVIWARQLSALVFLERLTGNEEAARKVWAGCDQKCRKLLPQDERQALERWSNDPI